MCAREFSFSQALMTQVARAADKVGCEPPQIPNPKVESNQSVPAAMSARHDLNPRPCSCDWRSGTRLVDRAMAVADADAFTVRTRIGRAPRPAATRSRAPPRTPPTCRSARDG